MFNIEKIIIIKRSSYVKGSDWKLRKCTFANGYLIGISREKTFKNLQRSVFQVIFAKMSKTRKNGEKVFSHESFCP